VDLNSMLGADNADPGRLAGAVQDVFGSQGVDGLLRRLRAGGLGEAVDSWVSTGANEPVEPQRLGEALGPDTVQQLSSKSGLSIEMLLPLLASVLPMIIDHLTKRGGDPRQAESGEGGGFGGLGDLLGSVLGGGGLGGMLGGGSGGSGAAPGSDGGFGGGLGGGLGDLLGGSERESAGTQGRSGGTDGGFGEFGGTGDKDRIRP
jgi:uncharacterized protein YidB (DUF937 family)